MVVAVAAVLVEFEQVVVLVVLTVVVPVAWWPVMQPLVLVPVHLVLQGPVRLVLVAMVLVVVVLALMRLVLVPLGAVVVVLDLVLLVVAVVVLVASYSAVVVPSVDVDNDMVLAVDVVVVVDSPDALVDPVGVGTGPDMVDNQAVHQDASFDHGDVAVVRLDDRDSPDAVVADAHLDTVAVVVLPVVVHLVVSLVAPTVAAVVVVAEHPGPVAGVVHSLPFFSLNSLKFNQFNVEVIIYKYRSILYTVVVVCCWASLLNWYGSKI